MKKYTGTTCKVAGCDQPRRVLGNGKLSTLCDAHQREAWRNGAAATRKQPGRAAAAPPPAARPQAAAPPGRASTDECAGCIYREVIEKLAKRDTRIGELVKALERVHELEREMFDQEAQPQHIPTGAPVEANALIIDGLDNTVSSAVLTVLDRAATDGAADLRQRMQAARMEGALLLRIHRMAGDEAHEA